MHQIILSYVHRTLILLFENKLSLIVTKNQRCVQNFTIEKSI